MILHNNALQGTGKQRGFPRLSLAINFLGLSQLVATNLASP